MPDKLIVFDSDYFDRQADQFLGQEAEFFGLGRALYFHLAREAQRRGIDVTTAKAFLAVADRPKRAACITYEHTRHTPALLARGVRPAICHSLESPLVAHRFYHRIAHYAGGFRHNYQFRGTHGRLQATGTIFHPLYFPIETRTPLPLRPWPSREHLVLVNTNKRAIHFQPESPKELLRLAAVEARFQVWRRQDPWLRSRELYVDRVQAIYYFSSRPGFALYGEGWHQPILGLDARYQKAARAAYKGVIAPGAQPKRELMSGYRFALCFENCVFPGYVTEKIFDCFLAGCIPIYWGAPDITDFVPAETFIDYRNCQSLAELDRYLQGLTEQEAAGYLQAARDFLASPAFDKFGALALAQEIMELLEAELAN